MRYLAAFGTICWSAAFLALLAVCLLFDLLTNDSDK